MKNSLDCKKEQTQRLTGVTSLEVKKDEGTWNGEEKMGSLSAHVVSVSTCHTLMVAMPGWPQQPELYCKLNKKLVTSTFRELDSQLKENLKSMGGRVKKTGW